MALDEQEVFNPLCVYREMGLKIGRLEQFEKSLQYFDKAVAEAPRDLRTLRGRALYRAHTGAHEDAMKDIETLLQADPNDIYVWTTKTAIKFLMCDFEEAMVDNLHKIPLRKKPDNFISGVMQCEDAIQNNVGRRAGHPLRDHFRIIRKLAWLRNFEKLKPYEPVSKYWKKKKKEKIDEKKSKKLAVPKKKLPVPVSRRKSRSPSQATGMIVEAKDPDSDDGSIRETLNSVKDLADEIPRLRGYPFRPIQNYTTNIENLMAERYLDTMYHDKVYIQKMFKDPGLWSPNKSGTKTIVCLMRKCLKYIIHNQELLRFRRPFYLLRLQDARSCGKLRERQLESERLKTCFCESEAKSMIEKLRIAVSTNHLRHVIDITEKLYSFCENNPKRTLPNRKTYLYQLCELARDGFYNNKSVRKTMTEQEKQIRIRVILGLRTKKQESKDSLVMQFKDSFLDKKKLCKTFERRVKACTFREELVWFYHELARLYFEQRDFEISKAYGYNCMRESVFLKDQKWMMNSTFLMIKVHLATRDKYGATLELESCKDIANSLEDKKLVDFLDRCITVVDNTEMDILKSGRLLEMKTAGIMRAMKTESLRIETQILFRRMNNLPPNKRMPIIPGMN